LLLRARRYFIDEIYAMPAALDALAATMSICRIVTRRLLISRTRLRHSGELREHTNVTVTAARDMLMPPP